MQGDNRVEAKTARKSGSAGESPSKRKTTARSSAASAKGKRTTARAKGAAAAEAVAAEAVAAPTKEDRVVARPRVLELYNSEVVPTMMREYPYRNIMEVPRIRKVVLNVGLGEALTNPKALESASSDLMAITGQKPIVTKARKSIAGFKLRVGNPIGVCVTLRGIKMYHFMDRMVNAALPRIRDFRGVSPKSFDGRGNYSLGIREQMIFPEIDYGGIERIRGFQVTITTTARTDGEASRLLALMGMPFAQEN